MTKNQLELNRLIGKRYERGHGFEIFGPPAAWEDLYAWAINTNAGFEHPFAEAFQSLEKDLRLFVENCDSCIDLKRDPTKPLIDQDEAVLEELVSFIKSYRRTAGKGN